MWNNRYVHYGEYTLRLKIAESPRQMDKVKSKIEFKQQQTHLHTTQKLFSVLWGLVCSGTITIANMNCHEVPDFLLLCDRKDCKLLVGVLKGPNGYNGQCIIGINETNI